ncbi:hypothetical protein OEZ85_006180 [Tetradesmus obliquus]|uniref:Trichome birefringence-like N-terminal domain-containing protein n=1 Tax=Tetradesmus obliquus TaxID=3088 RepID=A0ABY8UFU4_TETOB|nr:hypothetical protein OEZ85_006180 [Tetradesmus obliquus]
MMTSRITITKARSLILCFSVVSVLGLSATPAHAADSCPASYRQPASNELPLLFGGVFQRCAAGCQPRKDDWSVACNPTQPTTKRTCRPFQTAAVMAAARAELGGAPAQLTPCQLMAYLRHRTLWLIGDSHMKHSYYALRCFLLDAWDHKQGECAPSASPAANAALWRAADTNHTSVLRGKRPMTDVPKCIHLLEGGRICWVHSVRGEEFAAAPSAPEAPALLQVLQGSLASPQDIFLLNFGRWHFHNCIGLMADSYTQSLLQLGAFYQRTRATFPNMFFKVSGHDHTECDAAGNMVDPATRCVPAGQGRYPLSIGRRVADTAVNVLGRHNMSLVDSYALSLQLWQAHTMYADGSVDCNHWCAPGLSELDIWTLYEAFRSHPTLRPLAAAAAAGQQRGSRAAAQPACLPVTSDRPPAEWLSSSGSSSMGREGDEEGADPSSSSSSSSNTAGDAVMPGTDATVGSVAAEGGDAHAGEETNATAGSSHTTDNSGGSSNNSSSSSSSSGLADQAAAAKYQLPGGSDAGGSLSASADAAMQHNADTISSSNSHHP